MDNKQEKYMELQILEQQMKQLQQNLQTIEQQVTEIALIKKSLDDFSELNEKTEALVPLANGIFAKAEIKNNKELLVNVGSDVVVSKTIPETKELLENQGNEIEKIRNQLMEDFENVYSRIEYIQSELQGIDKE
jgi:prefoldin alpha subunit